MPQEFAPPWWAGVSGVAGVIVLLVGLGGWYPHPAPPSVRHVPRRAWLSVSVMSRGSDGCADDDVYLAEKIDDVRASVPLPTGETFASGDAYERFVRRLNTWAAVRGGWRSTNWITFDLHSAEPTVITGLDVDLVARNQVNRLSKISVGPGCDEPGPPSVSVDFAGTPPVVTRSAFPLTVAGSQALSLSADAGPECDCRWTAELHYTEGGQIHTAMIDDGGRPFHAVPADRVPAFDISTGAIEPD